VRFCHQCGHSLPLGTEKFCPECGESLVMPPNAETPTNNGNNYNSTNITGTSGDVFGSGVSGSGNIVGKEVGYTVNGNVINLHVESLSAETLEIFKKIVSTSTQIDTDIVSDNDVNKTEKVRETTTNKQEISQILKEVNRIGEEKGTEIKEIKAGEIQISSSELTLKEILLKGNEHYYKGEYSEAIEYYDKALEIDTNDAGTWYNKGSALYNLGKYNETIEYYDKALEIDPNHAKAWNNKGATLADLGKLNEAIEAFDKALEIDPNDADAWNNKGSALQYLGKNKDANKCFDKARQLT